MTAALLEQPRVSEVKAHSPSVKPDAPITSEVLEPKQESKSIADHVRGLVGKVQETFSTYFSWVVNNKATPYLEQSRCIEGAVEEATLPKGVSQKEMKEILQPLSLKQFNSLNDEEKMDVRNFIRYAAESRATKEAGELHSEATVEEKLCADCKIFSGVGLDNLKLVAQAGFLARDLSFTVNWSTPGSNGEPIQRQVLMSEEVVMKELVEWNRERANDLIKSKSKSLFDQKLSQTPGDTLLSQKAETSLERQIIKELSSDFGFPAKRGLAALDEVAGIDSNKLPKGYHAFDPEGDKSNSKYVRRLIRNQFTPAIAESNEV